MKEEENKDSIFKKILKLIKKNPALSGTIATVIFYVIIILVGLFFVMLLVYTVVAAFSTRFGFNSNELTSGKYKDKSLSELQEISYENPNACYESLSENKWQAFWAKVGDDMGAGINSECEFLNVINKSIKNQEEEYSEYGLKLSPGLVVSTIIYSYSNELNPDEELEISNPLTLLKDIAKEGLYNVSDIDTMVENMIYRDAYWYYTCDNTTCKAKEEYSSIQEGEEVLAPAENDDEASTQQPLEEEILNGYKCEKKFYFNVRFDKEKYLVFLRYGEDAALYYEAVENHNNSVSYSCDMCYLKWNDDTHYQVQLDNSKYLQVADYKSSNADNITITLTSEELTILKEEATEANRVMGKKYNISKNKFNSDSITYKDGFAYNNFPKFKRAFDAGTLKESELYTPKNIEKNVKGISDYSETMDELYNIKVQEEYLGTPNTAVESETKRYCPSDESCVCTNGNLRPPGVEGGSGNLLNPELYNNEEACNILATARTKKNVRLVTCPGYGPSRLPGGGTKYGNVYKAKDLITWQEYLISLLVNEIDDDDTIEVQKFQLLIAQTYAINRFLGVGTKSSHFYVNSDGEFEIITGTCAQSADYSEYLEEYVNGKYHDQIDEAYAVIEQQLLVDKDGMPTYAAFKNDLQNEIRTYTGKTYYEILDTPYIRSYTGNSANYKTAEVKSCVETNDSESGVFNADDGDTVLGETNGKYNKLSPKKGIFGSFPYYDSNPNSTSNRNSLQMDPTWRKANFVSVKKDCGNGLSMNWTVHKLAKSTFQSVQEKMCEITTSGIDGIVYKPSEISFSGPLSVRFVSDTKTISSHAWGIAIDVNNGKSYTVNGKVFKGVYDRDINVYYSFVNALGSESNTRNVNYILWKKIFQPLGFTWGGNWGRNGNTNTYDGMHFEIDWRQTK